MLVVILGLILVSCNSIEELKVNQIKGLEVKGVNGNVLELKVTAQIENPNVFSVHVDDADLTVFMKGNKVGKVNQIDKLDIEGHSTKEYALNLKVELTDVKNILGTAMQLFTGGDPEISVQGSIKVRSFLYSRTVQVSELHLMR
jgi:LEA14-like dessication related protein